MPADLAQAIESETTAVPASQLARATATLSARYRAGHGEPVGSFVRTPDDATAYAVYRLPATYAALRSAFSAAAAAVPSFQPGSMLDVGGGPGTAGWAAANIWPGLTEIDVIEIDEGMIRTGQRMAAAAQHPAVRDQRWMKADLTTRWRREATDLTVAGYVLGELKAKDREALIDQMWESTSGVCVLVEPGTPRGFAHIEEGTAMLSAAGAHIVAPFPADWRCVEHADDWCHFSVRLPRTGLHRRLKEGIRSFEDEKFSYVVASRSPGMPFKARVIRHPLIRPGRIEIALCTPGGVVRTVITRKNRDAFRLVRKLNWGDTVSDAEAALLGL